MDSMPGRVDSFASLFFGRMLRNLLELIVLVLSALEILTRRTRRISLARVTRRAAPRKAAHRSNKAGPGVNTVYLSRGRASESTMREIDEPRTLPREQCDHSGTSI